MSLRRKLIEATDRSVGRSVLASAATWHARRGTDLDVQIFYDGAWVHRIGTTYIPVSDRFAYRRDWDSALASIPDPAGHHWFHVYRPAPGDTIVDVGAGDGLDCVVFSRAVGESGRVLAIEAHPATSVLLEQACRLNGLGNVTPVRCAVSDRAGTVTMVEAGANRDLYSFFGDHGSERVTDVPAASLDALCAEHDVGTVDFLKMNIEGAERYALGGAADVLRRTRHVCIACHDFLAERDPRLATKALVVELLHDHGFDVVLREQHALPWIRDHVHGIRRGVVA
jgi:FkbM family methyltransferase